MPGRRLDSDQDLSRILGEARTVAVVGLSPRPARDSHRVAAYLKDAGYRIIPVHPCRETILGEPALSSLAEVRERIDVVNVFRRPSALPGLVPAAVAVGPLAIWFQIGVTHPRAEEAVLAAGVDLVVDRCLLVEHRRLMGD